VQAVSTCITDAYPALAASAIAALSLGENIFAAYPPLATSRMYEDLGFHWTSSTLAFLALVLSIVPVVLLLQGHQVRARSTVIE